MMRLKTGLVLAVLLLVGACGGSDDPKDGPTKGDSPSASEPAVKKLVAAPGAIGPVQVGMTVEEANATGWFEPRELADDDPCKEEYGPIQWKEPHTDALMVDVEDDTISLLGIRGSVKTAEGIGVGSTFEDVATAYPGVKIQESQVQGSIIYLQDGDQWLGLAFAQQPRKVKDSSKVVFIEAAEGDKPAAFLSGCGY